MTEPLLKNNTKPNTSNLFQDLSGISLLERLFYLDGRKMEERKKLFPSRRDPPRGYPGLELLRLGVGVGDHEVTWRGEEGLSGHFGSFVGNYGMG